MARTLFISCAEQDNSIVQFFKKHLQAEGYAVQTSLNARPELSSNPITTAIAVINLVSSHSVNSTQVMQECAAARQANHLLIPVLVSLTDSLPWYIDGDQIIDGTVDMHHALQLLLAELPLPTSDSGLTLGEARDLYLQRATLKSQHTLDAYRRSITLFLEFLKDRHSKDILLPVQQRSFVTPEGIPIIAFSAEDAPIFLQFAQWLLSPSSGKTGDKRPYKAATVDLRVSGVQNWFQYLDDHGWLPPDFQLAKAKRIAADEMRGQVQQHTPPKPPDFIEEVIYYYDTQPLPKHLRKPDIDQERVQRWELTRLRNRALLHTLAETGGRVSELLSLNLADFPPRHLNKQEVLRVEVLGKGGHMYYLRFYDSLPAIRAYITARGADLKGSVQGAVPLFVSHDPRYDGNRMSRIVAWRVVQRASKALGLQKITPHDFRHWRATQLINAGHQLDVVQDYLGHRSVETTRAYYAHTDPLRVDDAARETRLPDPDDLQ